MFPKTAKTEYALLSQWPFIHVTMQERNLVCTLDAAKNKNNLPLGV